jgi:hypothetical protein
MIIKDPFFNILKVANKNILKMNFQLNKIILINNIHITNNKIKTKILILIKK